MIEKICRICEKKFKVKLSQKRQLTCSEECRSEILSRQQAQRAKEKYKNLTWTCGEVTPPPQTYFKSKRFGLSIQNNIMGWVFVGKDGVVTTKETMEDDN